MSRRTRKWLALIAAAAMLVSLVPAGPASGSVVTEGGKVQPKKSASIRTHAGRDGIEVRIANLARDVKAVDIYRATAGEDAVKVNTAPVTDAKFLDKSAKPGVQYYYSAQVTDRSATRAMSRFVTADSIDPAKARVMKAERVRKTRAARVSSKKKAGATLKTATAPAVVSEARLSKMATTIGAGGIVTLTAAVTTWDPAHSPYIIRNDIIVPAGKKLVIKPGTKVYFDTRLSGAGAPGTNTNPTTKIDLIVHGTLEAKGLSYNKVLLSSILSTPDSSTATASLPNSNDWGSIFVDSKSASELSYAKIEYGSGIWAKNTFRPYILNCQIIDTNTTTTWPCAILFDDPVYGTGTPQIRIEGNTIATDGEGIEVFWTPEGANKGDKTVDPYIAKNTIRSDYPIDLEVWESGAPAAERGNAYVKGTITGNTLFTSDDGVYLQAYSYGTKTAYIQTKLSNNKINSDSSCGVYAYAWTEGKGNAYAKPTFSGDQITSYNECADVEAYNSAPISTTNYGVAYATPSFTNVKFRSTDDDTVYLDAETNGKGNAGADAVFSGGTIDTVSDNCVDAYTESEYGSASTSPKFTNVKATALDSYEVLYLDSRAYDKGSAKANPRWVGGSALADDDDCFYLYAESDLGTAECRPYVEKATLTGYDSAIYAQAYGSNDGGNVYGGANVSGTILNSKLNATYDAAYYTEGYAEGRGDVIASPYLSKSTLTCGDEYGLEAYANPTGGKGTASPTITDCTIDTDGVCVDAEVDRGTGFTNSADAVASPMITRTKLLSEYYEALYCDAVNNAKGQAKANPSIVSSTIWNGYDDYGMYLNADASDTGAAEVKPVVSDTPIEAYYEAVYVDANGPGVTGTSHIGGSFKNCTIKSATDNGFYFYSDNHGGSSKVDTVFTNCTVTSPIDYAYELYAGGYGSDHAANTMAPVITGGKVPLSGDGMYFEANTHSSGYEEKNLVAAKVTNCPVYAAWDYPIYTYAYTSGDGDAVNESVIKNCATTGYYGVEHDAYTNTNAGYAYNKAQTLGASSTSKTKIDAWYEDGVYNYAYSANGKAFDLTKTQNLTISAQDHAVYNAAIANAAAGVATGRANITGIVATTLWGAYDQAIEARSTSGAGSAVHAPTFSSNTVGGTFNEGIYSYAQGAIDVTSTPTVYNNVVNFAGENGIYLAQDGPWGFDSKVNITRNTISKPSYTCLYIRNVPNGLVQQNTFSNPGWPFVGNSISYTSGLLWENPARTALVKGNMFREARSSAIVYWGTNAPTTQYNSFGDAAGNWNRPFNYTTTRMTTAPTPRFDARYNWWGTTNSTSIGKTIKNPNIAAAPSTVVDYSGALSSVNPKVKSIGVTKYSTSVKFVVTFDRPMDKGVTRLSFGKASPYNTYKLNGTWNSAGTVFTGTYSPRSALPVGSWMYFSGVKDLPGNALSSTSKGFKL